MHRRRTIASEEKGAICISFTKIRAHVFHAVKLGISSVSLSNSQQYLQNLQNVALQTFGI